MIKRGVAWHRWKSRLSRYWNSGLSLSEYCRQNKLNLKTASKWRIRFRPDHQEREEDLEIVPLKMTIPEASPLCSPLVSGSGIFLEFGSMRISVSRDFDAKALSRVLTVLEVR